MRCYRRLLNITSEEVRRKIQSAIEEYNELTMVKKQKLRWFDHVSRSSRLAKTMLQGTVNGKRRTGRQNKRAMMVLNRSPEFKSSNLKPSAAELFVPEVTI